MRRRLVISTLILLGGCQATPTAPEASGSPAAGAVAGDTCGRAAAQAYVGRPRAEVPIPADGARFRMACTTCPMTMDFNPERLTVLFDQQTGRVTEARCG